MNELRFEGAGKYMVDVQADSLWIHKGMGAHWLEVQLAVTAPEDWPGGRLLLVEADLFAPLSNGPRAFLGAERLSAAFGNGPFERLNLRFLLTGAQLLALEAQRVGDLALELEVRGFLPGIPDTKGFGSGPGYPGTTHAIEYISVAESRWRSQLQGLGRSLGVEMTIPFPLGEGPQQVAADALREAQRRLGGNDVDGAILEVRRALEEVGDASGWPWPANSKAKDQLTAAERWSKVRSALEHQASGALHRDSGTKGCAYSRTEAEVLIAQTAALLRLLP
ncbi:hypothetical protein [Streptacidiphilus carbonis]|uniref:hypothetical protein n=1 Tax=Streptacidiphilus carbonis TaxID=105422 RepID=UPI0005AA67D5|nr:hypothetical protein [Streptacidiphilus carbonis]